MKDNNNNNNNTQQNMINQDLKVSELLSAVQSIRSRALAAYNDRDQDPHKDVNVRAPILERITLTYNTSTAKVRANFSVNLNVGITL